MKIVERLSRQQQRNSAGGEVEEAGSMIGATTPHRRDEIGEASRRLKIRVHSRLMETLDVSKLESLDPSMVSARVTAAINETLDQEGRLLTDIDRARLVSEIKNELLGLGPLEPLLRDDAISDILGERSRPGLRREGRQAAADRRDLPG
jgi:pilus assembly protein CpaF